MPEMPLASISGDRAETRLAWARHALGDPAARIEVAADDASFRSYWRVRSGNATHIVMDAPPGLEDIASWLDMDLRLRDAGLHAPRVHAHDTGLGFVLIEDFGARHYLDALGPDTADILYHDAFDALVAMQTRVDTTGMAAYDRAFLTRELALMPEWFLTRHLGHTLTREQHTHVNVAERWLVGAILEQPTGFVHRDFHSRNLLVVDRDSPGIIDFQGALIGPITYDLASLLRDCYIAWPQQQVQGWALEYQQRLLAADHLSAKVGAEQFLRWFDLTGLQRHLKVLGIFCRLAYRDGKRHYLDDLPRVFDYVIAVARQHPELAELTALLQDAAAGRNLQTPRVA